MPTNYIQEFDEEHGPDFFDHDGTRFFPDGACRSLTAKPVMRHVARDPEEQRNKAVRHWELRVGVMTSRFNALRRDLSKREDLTTEQVEKLETAQQRVLDADAGLKRAQEELDENNRHVRRWVGEAFTRYGWLVTQRERYTELSKTSPEGMTPAQRDELNNCVRVMQQYVRDIRFALNQCEKLGVDPSEEHKAIIKDIEAEDRKQAKLRKKMRTMAV